MKPDAGHIKKIKVVSNTHWDREWRRSFEKTRRLLIDMMDAAIEVLEKNPDYHSITLDGQSILIDDYLEIKPENREIVKKLIKEGKIIIGPYYTLPEQFSISHEPIVRNLLFGRKVMEKYGAKASLTAYTPCSWGQTGQLPQILKEFGIKRIMFYRGISHDEADSIYIWSAPDGSKVLASRFAIYARYNWYYLVHRVITRGQKFDKDYSWGKYDEIPFKITDDFSGEGQEFYIRKQTVRYDKNLIKQAIEEMLEVEGPHCNTDIFLGMNGHDLSFPYSEETSIISCAKELFDGKYEIEHTDLEGYWQEVEKGIEIEKLTVLTGERRAYLKNGKYTQLFGDTISSRTYLKQKDHNATVKLVYYAEPMAAMASAFGFKYPAAYFERGWRYLLQNHTHDSNGGCAPDEVCEDMEYRYRKVNDIADIITEDAMAFITDNLSGDGLEKDAMLFAVYNPLPFERDVVIKATIDVPEKFNAKFISLRSPYDMDAEYQLISSKRVKKYIDSPYDLSSSFFATQVELYANLNRIPGMGYRVYRIIPEPAIPMKKNTMISGSMTMENSLIKVFINPDGTVNIQNKANGHMFKRMNYITDEGECGDPWNHIKPIKDIKYSSLGVAANIYTVASGPLVCVIGAEYSLRLPCETVGNEARSDKTVEVPVKVEYTLTRDSNVLKVKTTINNRVKDHWLRVNFPTELKTDVSWTDSHFDILSHKIEVPDSTGWMEEARGTHPLRTFVSLSDRENGLTIFSKGLFEYEVFDNDERAVALTLIRAFKMSIMTEVQNSNSRSQCQGEQVFEYAICVHKGDWKEAEIQRACLDYLIPVRSAMSGRAKGFLPHQANLFEQKNRNLQITCIKPADDGLGIIIRLFNPLEESQNAEFAFGRKVSAVKKCNMDEKEFEEVFFDENGFSFRVEAKKIATFKVVFK
ncbi:MAG: alpha-mannosidase [Bacillota bacterium]